LLVPEVATSMKGENEKRCDKGRCQMKGKMKK
jgi:hypothetical protein